MNSGRKQFYRDQLRSARAVALADAEGFQAILHSLELIGQQLIGKVDGLSGYMERMSELADGSPLSTNLPCQWPVYHTSFRALYDELRRARNDAVHQGSHARTLTDHAIELAVIIEDALMSDASMISQFMIRDVVEAKIWHPVSFVRQQMLKYAFSYLPIRDEDTWQLIPECSVACYLRGDISQNVRKKRLATLIREAVKADGLSLLAADTVAPDTAIAGVLQRIGERPILVVDPAHEDVLVGLVTSSDLL